jgi:uncharacterized protein
MNHVIRPSASPSPCIQVCKMDDVTKLCIGCGRTLAEIAGWGSMTNEERAEVRLQLPARQARLRSEGKG